MSDFAKWLKTNTGLSDSSIYKYSHAADTVMEEMLALGVISKPFYEMTEIEIDIAIAVITQFPTGYIIPNGSSI